MNDLTKDPAGQPDMDTEAPENTVQSKVPSEKNYIVAVCLSGIFGVIGIHHFYLGRYVEGIIDFSMFCLSIYFYSTGQLLWAVLFFVADYLHTFIITIMLLIGAFKDGKGHVVCYPGQKLN